MNALLDTLGRLHPMVLHLPIGLIMGLALWELWRSWRGRGGARLDSAAVFIAWVGVLTAGITIGTGLLHERELGEGDATVDLHKWLGIGAGVGAGLTALAGTIARAAWRAGAEDVGRDEKGRGKKGSRGGKRRTRGGGALVTLYRVVLFSTVAVLVPAGHFGADITHGAGYVLAPLMPKEELAGGGVGGSGRGDAGGTGETSGAGSAQTGGGVEALRVAAFEVIASRCESCHGPVRTRGGLRLTSVEEMLTGGRHGAVILPGDPGASEMVRRMRLDVSDGDHMPPSGRPQATEEEIASVEAWIRSLGAGAGGAPGVAGGESAAPGEAGGVPVRAPGEGDGLPLPPAADAGAIKAVLDELHHVQALGEGSTLLWVDLSGEGVDDAKAERLLGGLVEQTADLSLARTGVTDEVLGVVASMGRLERLDLSGTAVGDDGVARLAGHPRLRTLVLAGTRVTDGAIEAIGSMAALRHLYLWDTAVTEDGLGWLSLLRPDLRVDTGEEESAPLEQEAEIVLGVPTPSGRAVNDVCPVTGSAVDARYTLEFEGRTIGFCCPNCPKEFAADPGRYAANLPKPE